MAAVTAVYDGIDRTILLVRQSMGFAVCSAVLSNNVGQLERRLNRHNAGYRFFGFRPS